MSDELRDKIAAVLERNVPGMLPIAAQAVADAVIAELKNSATECWEFWPARQCLILGNVDE